MKNRSNPGGAPLGPKDGWAAWRDRRNKALGNPRRSGAAKKLNEPKGEDTPAPTSREP